MSKVVTVAIADNGLEADELVDYLKSLGVPAGVSQGIEGLTVVVPADKESVARNALAGYASQKVTPLRSL